MMAGKTLDLFDTIHAYVGCEYISDLPIIAKTHPKVIADALRTVTADNFSLTQWNDALNYLVQAPAQETAEEAYALLISALSAVDAVR